MSVSPLELLLFGVIIVAAIKLFSSRRENPNQDEPRSRPQGGLEPNLNDVDRDSLMRQRQAEAYERAQQAWDFLRSEPGANKPAAGKQQHEPPPQNLNLPEGFDYGEFLDGAKAIYARIKDSWHNRELDDIQAFTTDKAFNELSRRAEMEPRSGRIDILLIEAKMVDYRDQGPVQRAQVFYDVLVKRDSTDSSDKIQEVWDFVKGGAYGDHWKLDEIKPVDEVAGQPQ